MVSFGATEILYLLTTLWSFSQINTLDAIEPALDVVASVGKNRIVDMGAFLPEVLLHDNN